MSTIDLYVEHAPYVILTDGPSYGGLSLDVPKETFDELIGLANSAYRFQTLLRILWDRAKDEYERQRVEGRQLALFDL